MEATAASRQETGIEPRCRWDPDGRIRRWLGSPRGWIALAVAAALALVASDVVEDVFEDILINPLFYIPLALLLVLEKLLPAVRMQRLFTIGLAQDAIWLLLNMFFVSTVLSWWIDLLEFVYDHTLWFLTIESVAAWPVSVAMVVGFLGTDFLDWLHHWVRHKVPLFWEFHALHHSQRELNLFTDLRIHPVEHLVALTIRFVPVMVLGLSKPEIFNLALITLWYTRFIHANVRTNLGPLRHVLVTPQFHRIHHSIEPRHRDQNFGVIFSFWDRLFGTVYPGCDEYPATGIADEDFPHETSYREILTAPFKQLAYPFRRILAR